MKDIGIFEGERAKNYDQFVRSWIPSYNTLLSCLPNLLDMVQASEVKNVLVVGSGTGNELLSLVKSRPKWQFLGVDPSADMNVQAQEKLAAFPNVKLREGYVNDLPIAPKFQAATLLLVLHFLDDDGSKLALLKGIADRMEQGATFVLADIFGKKEGFTTRLDILRTMFPPNFLAEDLQERLDRIRDHIQYIPETRLAELFKAAGFTPPTRFFQMAIWGAWVSTKR
ncbi:MAG: class I SAM-dependent methyltransferase [Bacteroidota bacterium]